MKKKYLIKKMSPFTGKINTQEIECTEEQIKDYSEGVKHIQDIFPEMSREEREFLISGITAEEWQEMFGEEK